MGAPKITESLRNKILEIYKATGSVSETAAILNREGFRTPGGAKWKYLSVYAAVNRPLKSRPSVEPSKGKVGDSETTQVTNATHVSVFSNEQAEIELINVIRSNLATSTKRKVLREMCDWVN